MVDPSGYAKCGVDEGTGKSKKVNKTIDSLTGEEVGRFIVDPKGNTLIEPVGGKTIKSGYKGLDTETMYPNGSSYQCLNPNGHKNSPGLGHGYGHPGRQL